MQLRVLSHLGHRFTRWLRRADLRPLPWWESAALQGARIVYAVVRELSEGQLTLRAMSLVYTTLLALVPLLAVSFSVLKAFGVHNQVEPALEQFLAPLGPQASEITNRLVEFVDRIRVGVLGALGVALLLYTVVALMQKVERAFNYAWRVHRHRNLAQRFSHYLSVLLIGPVLVFAAMGVTASVLGSSWLQQLATIEPFGAALELVARLVPYLLVIGAFSFVYAFIPNTRVRPASALAGAVAAGVLWQTTGWGFASFVANAGNYAAVYSAFATLILFMIWLYLSWLILLVGASVAYYHQHPRQLLSLGREGWLSPWLRERAGLALTVTLAQRLYARRPPPTASELADALRLPQQAVERLLEALEAAGLLRSSGEDDREVFLLEVPPDALTANEVLQALRHHEERAGIRAERLAMSPAVAELLESSDQAARQALGDATLRQLARSAGPATAPPGAAREDPPPRKATAERGG